MEIKTIVVIGGGPAGMMAAIRAAELGQKVILAEINPILGKKLLLSGKGRCNLTNKCDLASFLARFSGNGEFLRDAFKKFFNEELIDFFEKGGLKLQVERQLRVFPAAGRSDSVLGVLLKKLRENKAQVIHKAGLKDLVIQDKKIKGVLFESGNFIAADKVILATGGVSYAFTGSTGKGLELAQMSGHRIVGLRPGLVPLEARQNYHLEGLTLENIRIKFSDGEKEIVSDTGEMLFTKTGISGPLVLSLSGRIVDWMSAGRRVYAEIDLKPALSREQLNSRLLREFKAGPKKNIKSVLKGLLPKRLADVFTGIAKIPAARNASQVSQAERLKLIDLLKAFRLDITRPLAIEEAMVTRGGVSLKDINPRTMESRLIKGLYFAGEMIDVDADTGGFNLQAAFSTGYLAGESAALTI